MGNVEIGHQYASATYNITTALATTAVIDVRSMRDGMYIITAASSCTSLTWYVLDNTTGTFIAAYTEAATPAAVVQANLAASRAYPIPTALMAGAHYLKAVGDAACSNMVVMLKG